VEISGTVRCWGRDDQGQASPPDGSAFEKVAVSSRNYRDWRGYSCALDADGMAACWGQEMSDWELVPPVPLTPPDPGPYIDISISVSHNSFVCAVRTDGTVTCWGGWRNMGSKVPAGSFKQVSAGEDDAWALAEDGSLRHFGELSDAALERPESPVGLLPGAYQEGLCAILDTGALACWGWYNTNLVPDYIKGNFVSLGVGEGWVCAVTVGGVLKCWGDDYFDYNVLDPPG
jgi:hypothetical protein